MARHLSVTILFLVLWVLFSCVTAVAQNAPVSTIGVVNSYGNNATVTVTATGISDIGSFSMEIHYNPSIVHPGGVDTDPLLGGNMSVNLNNPGVILLSWYTYPGLTLSGNPVILSISFSKLAIGTSALSWLDNGYSCSWYDGNGVALNDVPASAYYINGSVSFNSPDAPHSIFPSVSSCQGTVMIIPVRVTGFNNIGKVTLAMNYNAVALSYQDYTNTSGFPGLVVELTQPGTLVISGTITSGGIGFSLADSSALVTLNFNYLGGAVGLAWADNGVCLYTGPPPSFFHLNDVPHGTFYINGSITEIPIPAPGGEITGPAGGNVCQGQSGVNFSIAPIPNANWYVWSLPPGAVITSGELTNNITVTFGYIPGNWEIGVSGSNVCGNGPVSPVFPIHINETPSITLQPVSPGTVNAGAGSASFFVGASGSLLAYQWQESAGSWVDLSNGGFYSGVHSSTLTITNPPASMDGNHYRCIVSGFCEPQAVSNGEAKLSVNSVTGTGSEVPYEDEDNKTLVLKINPNPAARETTLRYFLPADGLVVLEIRNMVGEKTDVVFKGEEVRGSHKLRINLQQRPGLYFVTLTLQTSTAAQTVTEKIIVH